MAGVSYFPCRPIKTINTDGIIYQAPYAMPPLLADAAYVAYAPQIHYSTDVNVALESIGSPSAIPGTASRAKLQLTADGTPYMDFTQPTVPYYVPGGITAVPQNDDNYTIALIGRDLTEGGGFWRSNYVEGSYEGSSWQIAASDYNASKYIRISMMNTSGTWNSTPHFTMPNGLWWDVVVRVTNGVRQVYIGNVLAHEATIGKTQVVNTSLTLMAQWTGSGWNGGIKVGDVHLAAFWNRVLTNTEIAYIHGYKPAD